METVKNMTPKKPIPTLGKTIETSGVEDLKQNLEYQRKKDNTLVRGIFRYHEVPNGQLEFNFRGYKGDPIRKYHMLDGEEYSIPLGVAKHLNKSVAYPRSEHYKNEKGNFAQRVATMIHRCSFQSLEFIDIDDVPSTL